MCFNGRGMSKPRHTTCEGQGPIAERSAVAGGGGLWRRHSCRRVLATFQSPVSAGGKLTRNSAATGTRTRDWKVPRTCRLESLRYGVWSPGVMEWTFSPPSQETNEARQIPGARSICFHASKKQMISGPLVRCSHPCNVAGCSTLCSGNVAP